jgi:predicted 3-demethylubiquinone-9 3-methyltransferase (glyoxalase superfamily)
MTESVTPFLMFEGNARAFMESCVALFPDARIEGLVCYGPGEAGPEGSVKMARLTVGGQTIRCTDSFVSHDFSFTPAFSLFVECESEARIHKLVGAFSEGGSVLMPLGHYGFNRLFAWINDRYGVSWQLNLT